MAYCTPLEARAAGATGDDATLTPLIAEARSRIDRYTSDLWEPTPLTLVANVERDGTAYLPHRPIAISEVRGVDSTTPLPASAYAVRSSAVRGQVDALVFGGSGISDPLVLGAEPWAGGYRSLFWGGAGARSGGQVQVSGTFGRTPTPWAVRRAAALIVAALQRPLGALDVDDEGNAVSITGTATAQPGQSTGSPDADLLLAPLVRRAGIRIV